MAHSYKGRRDLEFPIHLPDGRILSDREKILTGEYWARFPEHLERIPDEDPIRMITEDIPETTPNPVMVEEPEKEIVKESKENVPEIKEEKPKMKRATLKVKLQSGDIPTV